MRRGIARARSEVTGDDDEAVRAIHHDAVRNARQLCCAFVKRENDLTPGSDRVELDPGRTALQPARQRQVHVAAGKRRARHIGGAAHQVHLDRRHHAAGAADVARSRLD